MGVGQESKEGRPRITRRGWRGGSRDQTAGGPSWKPLQGSRQVTMRTRARAAKGLRVENDKAAGASDD